MTERNRNLPFKDLPLAEKASFILQERMPRPEQLKFSLDVKYLDPNGILSREEKGKVIAMGDRTAISYEQLADQVVNDRNKPEVELDGEKMSATSAFYLQYALAARSGKEIAHTSIMEQINPGPTESGGDSPIIVEGVSILAALRDIVSLDYFGFEAFSSRGALFPENYRRIPSELMNTSSGEKLKILNDEVYRGYEFLTRKALEHYLRTTPQKENEKPWQYRWRVLNLALDDSRQVTNGTFLNHFAMHPNSALALREGIVALSSSELPEVVEIANRLRKLGEAGLPTLMRYTDPSEFTQSLFRKRDQIAKLLKINEGTHSSVLPKNTLGLDAARVTKDADINFLATFISKQRGVSMPSVLSEVSTLSKSEIGRCLSLIFDGITVHDKPPEELQSIQIEAHLITDVGAVYDLLRHRPVLHLISDFSINQGFTIPDSFKVLGLEDQFQKIIKLNERAYELVSKLGLDYERVFAPYFVSRAHLQNLSMLMDGYEAFHLLKIRADSHAHPNVQVPMGQLLRYLQNETQVFNFMPKK